MKKSILLIIVMLTGSIIFAQTSKRTSAYNYLRNGKLDKAKEYIDPTISNEKTMADPKTWFYRGNIYLQLALTTEPAYQNLDPDPLGVAYESYKKTLELDEKETYKVDIVNNMQVIAIKYYELAVGNYNEKEYIKASGNFEKAYQINMAGGKNDTAALQNAAIAAQIGNDHDLALRLYQQILESDYGNPQVFNSMSEIYKAKEDTAGALSIIQEGRTLYPDNFDLLIAETNIYLAAGDVENALTNLEKALEKDTTNPIIYFALGTNYDQMGKLAEAEAAYKSAIELDDNYFDAYYNLGALYVNQAADIQKVATDLPLDATEEYDRMKEEADGLLKKSLPYLEKAYEINPDDIKTLVSLKEIYTRLNMLEKLKEVNAKLKKE